ncbi:MAG: ArnT family glycosyltransferase [Planctomycetota bacterium]
MPVRLDETRQLGHAYCMATVSNTYNRGSSAGYKQVLMLVAVVVLLALPVRLYLALDAEMISRDGVGFIHYAQGLADDPLSELRIQSQHPLYSFMVLVAHKFMEGLDRLVPLLPSDAVLVWQFSAMSVTFLGGLFLVVSVYVLTRLLFDSKVAFLSAVLTSLTAEFCQYSADALTDMPFLVFFLLGLSAGVRGLRDRSYFWLAVAGVLSGITYLARPEGAEVALTICIVLLFLSMGWSWRQRLTGVLVVVISAGVVASPYMLVTGKLVQKKSVGRFFCQSGELPAADGCQESPILADFSGFLTAQSCNSGCFFVDLFRALVRVIEYWGRSLRVTLLLPAVVWLIWRGYLPVHQQGCRLVATVMFLHLLILMALIFRFDYLRELSLRHVMILAGLCLPFSAAGLSVILDRVAANRRGLVGLVLVTILVGPTLPWMFETRYGDEVYLRRAGEWIGNNSGKGHRVMTDLVRVTYYADGDLIHIEHGATPAAIMARARVKKPDWLVFTEKDMLDVSTSFADELMRELHPPASLVESHREPGSGRHSEDRVIFYL